MSSYINGMNPRFTQEERDTLSIYIENAKKVPRLSKAETTELFHRMREMRDDIHSVCTLYTCPRVNTCMERSTVCTVTHEHREICERNGAEFEGYITLRNHLVASNTAFVTHHAIKFGARYGNVLDLIQEGNLGLIKAVEKYNPDLRTSFSTYAHHWVRKLISHYVKDKLNIVRKKIHLQDLMHRVERIYNRIDQEQRIDVRILIQRGPITAKLILEELHIEWTNNNTTIRREVTEDWINPILERLQNKDMSIYEPAINDETILNSVSAEDEQTTGFYDLLNEVIDIELYRVPVTEAEIIKMRFGLSTYEKPMNPVEIATVLGLTRQRVEQRLIRFFERKLASLRGCLIKPL